MPDHDFSDLKALFLNCSLKTSAETSNTQVLMDNSIAIMERTASRSTRSGSPITSSRPASRRT